MVHTATRELRIPFSARDSLPPPAPPARLPNVDRLRVVAITFVVAFHLDLLPADVTRIGVTTFFLIGLMFRARKPLDFSTAGPILDRARRLLLPWAFWSLVYALLQLRRVVFAGLPFAEAFDPWMPLYGTSAHLWFLPWLFVLEIVTSLAARVGALVSERYRAAFWFGVAALFPVLVPIPVPYGPTWLLAKWVMALVAVPAALAFAELSKKRPAGWLALAAAVLAAWALTSELTQTIGWSARYALAAALLALALLRPGRIDRIDRPSRIAVDSVMGVYAIHPIAITLLGPVAWWPHPLGLVAVLLVSFAATRLLKLTPVKRFI